MVGLNAFLHRSELKKVKLGIMKNIIVLKFIHFKSIHNDGTHILYFKGNHQKVQDILVKTIALKILKYNNSKCQVNIL